MWANNLCAHQASSWRLESPHISVAKKPSAMSELWHALDEFSLQRALLAAALKCIVLETKAAIILIAGITEPSTVTQKWNYYYPSASCILKRRGLFTFVPVKVLSFKHQNFQKSESILTWYLKFWCGYWKWLNLTCHLYQKYDGEHISS